MTFIFKARDFITFPRGLIIRSYLSLLNPLCTLTYIWAFQMCHYLLLRLLCKVIPRAMKHLCFTLCSGIPMSLWVFGFIAEAGLELGNSRLWKDCLGGVEQVLSSEHARAIVLVNVQSIWLPTHNIHESRLVAIPR